MTTLKGKAPAPIVDDETFLRRASFDLIGRQPTPAELERFLAEVSGESRRAGYVLLGDDAFLMEMCRKGVMRALVPEEMKDFCLHDLDLGQTSIFEALDLAQTPSLMAPFQVLFLRNVKTLYGRGSKKEEFKAIDEYFRRPNPQALVIFVADYIALPQDLRRMDMTDKERAEKIRETLGDVCGMVELPFCPREKYSSASRTSVRCR